MSKGTFIRHPLSSVISPVRVFPTTDGVTFLSKIHTSLKTTEYSCDYVNIKIDSINTQDPKSH